MFQRRMTKRNQLTTRMLNLQFKLGRKCSSLPASRLASYLFILRSATRSGALLSDEKQRILLDLVSEPENTTADWAHQDEPISSAHVNVLL